VLGLHPRLTTTWIGSPSKSTNFELATNVRKVRLRDEFPIWTTAKDTPALARTMLAADLGAVLTCVDPKQLNERFVGRQYDEKLLAELPAGVGPCGERGEFHTFCSRCPEFSTEIPVTIGDVVEREGFWFCELRRSPRQHLLDLAVGIVRL
jgi:diphthamide synthase (EF-2-diphthine--ammonia ligase)